MTVIGYVHHQLKGAATAACAVAISVLVAYGVRDAPEEDYGFWQAFGGASAMGVLAGLVSVCPLKWVGEVSSYKSAHPLAESDAVPSRNVDLRRDLLAGRLLALITAPTLIVSFWFPWFALAPLISAVDRLMQAGHAARWERKHGVVLWWGQVKGRPFAGNRLQYSSAPRT
ncbi:hypothetical protein [Streptomyces sp. NPDC048825]|uniref:hypothetical protein n=1 Tax=Streptomyces sp. NPDC048825 TaxID=3365592 RepID=UPI003722CEA7